MTTTPLLANYFGLTEAVLHWTAAVLVSLNEITIISCLWVVSKSPAASSSCYDVSPTFTAIAYALSEPLWVLLLRNLPLPSWLPFPSVYALEIASSCHGITAVYSAKLLSRWLETDNKAGKSPSTGKYPSHYPSNNQTHTLPPSTTSAVYVAYLLPVQTAAIQNAVLTIWAQDLQLPYSQRFPAAGLGWKEHPLANFQTNINAVLSYIVFTGCGNYFWCKITCRAWTFGPGRRICSQLYDLVILLAIRLCTRKLLGVDVLPGLQVL